MVKPTEAQEDNSWSTWVGQQVGSVARTATAVTGNVIDFSRVGRSFRNTAAGERTGGYSAKKLAVRAGMVAVPAALAYVLPKEEVLAANGLSLGLSDSQNRWVVGITTFLVAHTITMYPIIRNRWKVSAENAELKQEIAEGLEALGEGHQAGLVRQEVESKLGAIEKYQAEKAITTLTNQRSMLRELKDALGSDNAIEEKLPAIRRIGEDMLAKEQGKVR